ncbi:unnamed protein product [Arabidopsis lyrata]|nr:unnamed protein product [Arabidopsis lyrata]
MLILVTDHGRRSWKTIMEDDQANSILCSLVLELARFPF